MHTHGQAGHFRDHRRQAEINSAATRNALLLLGLRIMPSEMLVEIGSEDEMSMPLLALNIIHIMNSRIVNNT